MFRQTIQFKLTFVLMLYMRLCLEVHAASDICTTCKCIDSGTIDCSNRNLTSVPQTIPSTVETLYLQSNKITNIERGAFENLTYLEYLYLSNNNINNIEVGAFQNLPRLKYLYLEKNNIRNIEEGTFQNLTRLSYLQLADNSFNDIEVGTFRNLPNLEYLHLYRNNITNIEEGAFHNHTNLYALYLSENEIRNIEVGTLENLPSLRELDLEKNKIENFEVETFQSIPSLRSLNLAGNNIRNFEEGILQSLPSLRELKLSDNSIRNVEVGVFHNHHSLRELYLERNKITIIKEGTFKNLTNLYSIYLSANKIRSIEGGVFHKLPTLDELDLENNKIENFEVETFQSIPSLRKLYLSDNSIRNIEVGVFHNHPSLRELHLQRNNIRNIEEGTFQNLTNLIYINLESNKITNIEEGAFQLITNLKYLYLQINNISNIEVGIFPNLPILKTLDLSSNQIKTYEDGAFLFLPSITEINLASNNDMMCECHLPAVVNYTKRTYNRDVDVEGMCHTDLGNNQDKVIPILEYSQCKDYSLFPRNLQCQTCSGIMCNDSEVTNCKGDEPVCQSKTISMNNGTLKLKRSCSTYRECVEDMKNNILRCNTRSSDSVCVACCIGNLCNKNEFVQYIKELSNKLLNISQNSVYFKEDDIALAVDILEKIVPLLSNVSHDKTLNNIILSINNIINTPEEILMAAEKSDRIVNRMLDIIEAIPEKISLEEQKLVVLHSNLGIGVIEVDKDIFNGVSYAMSFGTNETEIYNSVYPDRQRKTMDFVSLPNSLLKHLKDKERSTISRISFFSMQNEKLYRIIQKTSSGEKTKIVSRIIAANIPNIRITNLDEPVTISFNLIDQSASNLKCVSWDESSEQNPCWSEKGCSVSNFIPGKKVVCSCNQLASVALLMDEGNIKMFNPYLLYFTLAVAYYLPVSYLQ